MQKTKTRWGGGSSISFSRAFQACERQLVRLVDDVDLVAALDRLQHGAVANLAHVVDAALRGGVHLDHVERAAVRDRLGDGRRRVEVRVRAALGIQRLGEDARHRGLPRSARPGEQVRLPHLPVLDRVPQRADDRLLADHVAEVERAVGAVQGGHGPIVADSGLGRTLLRSRRPVALGGEIAVP